MALWLVGLPCSVLCSRALGWGVTGAFGGFCVGIATLIVLLWHRIALHFDWQALVDEARGRLESDEARADAVHGGDGSGDDDEQPL
jgi:hypothetical protein